MPDAQIRPTGTVPTPADYVVPDSAELLLKSVYAQFNGSGAASPYLPLVRIISDAGLTVIEAVADTTIAAGASADASWFPHLASKPSSGGGGIQFDVDNVGGSLEVETTGLVPTAFSQPESSRDGATSFGMALNVDNGLLLTTPPDSFFNSGEPVLEVDQLVPSGDYGAQGIVVQVADSTPNGSNGVQGIQVRAGADGTQEVDGLTVTAAMGSHGTSDALAGSFVATNQGTGREIAVAGAAGRFKSGANALCFQGLDAANNPVFEVYADGNIHIKTGATVTADL